MKREERRHPCAAADGASGGDEHGAEQQGVGGVPRHVLDQLSTGMQPEELAVERQREPGQRDPVRLMDAGERPAHRSPIEAIPYPWLAHDVDVVVEVDVAV